MSDKPLILVVDDDAPILLLMRNLLREFGFDTVTASSGPEGIAAARESSPDLILLDLNMPGMSGDEVMRELRGIGTVAAVPVFILSGEPVDPDELARLGANGAILKPFDVPSLIEILRAHTGVAPR